MNRLIFLIVTTATFLTATHALSPPAKPVPLSVVRRLLGPAIRNGAASSPRMSPIHPHVARLLNPDQVPEVSRQDDGGSVNDTMTTDFMSEPYATPDVFEDYDDNYYYRRCAPKDRNGHVMTLALDYYGPLGQAIYADRHNHFLRFALGLSPENIGKLEEAVLNYFKVAFGLHFNGTVYNSKTGAYYDPVSKLNGGPVIFSEPLRVVATSTHRTPCTDTTAVLGGWMLNGEDVLVKGDLHPEGKVYEGHSSFWIGFMALNVGTPYSERIVLGMIIPVNCPENGACAVTGRTAHVEYDAVGWVDGVAISYELPGKKYTLVKRMTIMSPGRFTPGLV